MNFKKHILAISLGAFLMVNPFANASKLPNDVLKFAQSQLPKVQQRFDSVLVLGDDVMYIPLSPPTTTTVDQIKIEYTYPENKTLKDLPEVVLLNNGYSFLKVFKDSEGNYTLTKKDDLPIKVRLGLMPQDMLTPIGLKMPESLKLTLGDLLIPTKEENSLALKEGDKKEAKNPYTPAVQRNEFIPSVHFEDKKTFINPRNSKFLAVYDNKNQTPIYELKLSSMPLKIISSQTSKVALVLYWNGKNVEIIDLKDERVISTIELKAKATDVVLDEKNNIAYVSSQGAKAIYMINLNSMQLDRIIELDQQPTNLAYSEEDDTVVFFDEYLSKIFKLENTEEGYRVTVLGDIQGVAKILANEKRAYAITRTLAQLHIFDKEEGKLITTIDLDKKPTDALIYQNKIYILCAMEGIMDVYDIEQNKIISRERLSNEGFYSKITLIPNENNIIITGLNSKSYLIYSLDKMKLTHSQDSYIDVSNMVIIDKSQRL